MEMNKKIRGCALLCDEAGTIIKVLRDDFGLGHFNELEGKLFTQIVDSGTHDKSLNFFLDISTAEIAFDYQINLKTPGNILSLYFIGVKIGKELLIIGAENHKEAVEFTEHLHRINNEQANRIRELLKDKMKSSDKVKFDDQKVFDDLTRLNNELANLQREMTKKNIELAQLNEMKNAFLGMAAHDLRNPLSIFQTFTEFLIEEAADCLTDEHIGFLQVMHTSAGNMLSLVEDLLDYTKIEAGRLDLELQEVNLYDSLKNSIKPLNTLAHAKKVRIILSSVEDHLVISLDPPKMNQVYNNILTNAIKFSHPDSEVTVNLESDNEFAIIRFIDSGEGMEPQKLEQLFVPFSKASSKGTSGEKGSGLGLFIVKRIIEGHKGKIEIYSMKGKGTEVIVKLPLHKIN